MTEIFGVPTQALFGQLLIGLINGSFYALLSLGLAVIFTIGQDAAALTRPRWRHLTSGHPPSLIGLNA